MLQLGCCGRKKTPGKPGQFKTGITDERIVKDKEAVSSSRKAVVDSPLEALEKTGLNYSLDSRGKKQKQVGSAFFETQYLEGIKLMEAGEFTKAVSVFEAIGEKYPNSEEASVAELCIAELYFRSKSNQLALETYKKIIEKYPNSHAAENARAGVKYLQDFEKYEQEHIPSDVEDRKRRGY